MNNDGNKNFMIALLLCGVVLFGWQYFFAAPQMKADQARQAQLAKQVRALTPQASPNVPGLASAAAHMSRDAALKAGGARVAIDTPMVDGSIRLTGAKLDDLRLKTYHETLDPKSPEIVLLAPKSTDYPYYAEFGWAGQPGQNIKTPGDDTLWKQDGDGVLSPGKPVTLSWDNGQGLVFTRVIAVDSQYMFTVTDSVASSSGGGVLYPYAFVAREGVPPTPTTYVLHQGFVGVAGGSEIDANYDDFKNPGTPPKSFSSTGGWLGITDKYWMAAVVPPQTEAYDGAYAGSALANGTKAYQANYRLAARKLAPGGHVSVTHKLFAGAKVVDILRSYQDRQQISHFDLAVDWGWFWFLTRPFFWLLDTLYKLLGNFGLAILALTVVVKLLFFPLANASFRSMSKMKKLQPEMERLKKHHEGDAQKFQLAVMELYKREKANPVAGCVPILLTIPVFFSLYKVLSVTIEMRHAPFYGWIHDLSAQDPTSFINLFGLLPFNPHAVLPSFLAFLAIGIWPVLYGITMWAQQKLNPAPTDPVQAKMFAFMPLIFTFMFAALPAGLVIYYTWNSLLTIAQQWFIMHREGVEIHLFEGFKRKKPPANDG